MTGLLVLGLIGVVMVCGVSSIGIALYRSQVAMQARERLQRSSIPADTDQPEIAGADFIARSPVLRRYWWLSFPVAALAALICGLLLSIPWPYLLAIATMVLLIGVQVDGVFVQRRIQRTEQQLADSIDMMIAAVKSGASLQTAMESGAEASEKPWRTEINQVVQAIRYGDDPVIALGDLSERLPLESVTLFSQTLAVNWRVGGKLAVTLANVARTIRDRIELSRRMFAMTTQARLSVISVVCVTYFIGALMWRNDPERMSGFLSSLVGQALVSTAIILQAVGMVWISWLSKPKF